MKQPVMIKGMKSGIILALDEKMPYDELLKAIAEQFKKSSDFLGEAPKAIRFTGRKLTDDEQSQIIYIIEQNCKLHIVCVMEDDPKEEEKFSQAIEERLSKLETSTGLFHKGGLRSGQVLSVESSIVVLGDINAGAKIVSKGNIVILGALKGNAFAGCAGNMDAFVVAMDMDPVQIRIGDTIAKAPDKKGTNHKEKQSKIAFWEDGNIYVEPLSKEVFGDIRL